MDYNFLANEQHVQVIAFFLPEAPSEMLKIFDEVHLFTHMYVAVTGRKRTLFRLWKLSFGLAHHLIFAASAKIDMQRSEISGSRA